MSRTTSEIFFENGGLTRWGREPGFVAPKPLPWRKLRKLGDALDHVETRCGCHGRRYHLAFAAYGEAITARNLYHQCKFENLKRAPKAADKFELNAVRFMAEERIDEIVAARPEFATAREFIDANAAFMLAKAKHDIAERKFQEHQRQARADKRDNINRR